MNTLYVDLTYYWVYPHSSVRPPFEKLPYPSTMLKHWVGRYGKKPIFFKVAMLQLNVIAHVHNGYAYNWVLKKTIML